MIPKHEVAMVLMLIIMVGMIVNVEYHFLLIYRDGVVRITEPNEAILLSEMAAYWILMATCIFLIQGKVRAWIQ